MIGKTYYEDGILEIVVLGPMGSDEKHVSSSTKRIGEALESLLVEEASARLLSATKTSSTKIELPENWMDAEIVRGIMTRVDTADLVVINLTPFNGIVGSPSPNVYYELGLVHALGMPVICIAQEGTEIPFYARHNRIAMLRSFDMEDVKDALRKPLLSFLDPQDANDLSDNRITQFYGGLPIVDISAAVGLATGYYYNFVSRLLSTGGIISCNKDRMKRLLIVRPKDVMNAYDEDKDYMEEVLRAAGYQLRLDKDLTIPPGDDKGGIWVYHIDGVIIDLPRTIYPLKISPRILALRDRIDNRAGLHQRVEEDERTLLLRQLSERLLDRVQNAIVYHARKDGERFRYKLLDFTTIEELPSKLKSYGVLPQGK